MSIDIVTDADARANVVGQPANVFLYGGPGTLKTTDAVSLFVQGNRCDAFFIPCEDGALKPIPARGLPVPDHPKYTVKSWGALYETLSWFIPRRGNYRGLIIDGFTPLTSYLYKEAEDANKGARNKFAIPMQVRSQLLALREWIRQLNIHCILIGHPTPPAVQDGIFYPGGFGMSPKTLTDTWFGQTDTVLRVDYLNVAIGQPPVRVYYTGGPTWPTGLLEPGDWRLWRTKNREGCASAIVPADLGAFLRGRQPPYNGI